MRATRQRSGRVRGANAEYGRAFAAEGSIRVSLVGLGVVILLAGCGREPASAGAVGAQPAGGKDQAASNSPLYCPPIDLGVLYPGEVVEHRVWLENRSDEPIEISKVETSCECVTARVETTTLCPKGRALAVFRYDGSRESIFRGSLAVAVIVSATNAGRVVESRLERKLESIGRSAISERDREVRS